MERLTWEDESGYYAPKNVTLNCLKQRGELVDRLAVYEDLEEQGRLVVLPCKVDAVFYINHINGSVMEKHSECVSVDRGGNISYCIGVGEWIDSDDIGKTAFLTHAEAEAALKGVSDDA